MSSAPTATEGGGLASALQGVDAKLNETQRADMDKMLGNPILFPKEFKDWMMDFVATNIPLIPFSHLFGSHINIARSGNFVAASESKTATSYGDLATVGPQLTNLSDGTYLIAWGVRSRSRASISVNGASAVDADSIYATETEPPGGRMKIVSMQNNNANTVCVKYTSGTYADRWLTVIRIGAP